MPDKPLPENLLPENSLPVEQHTAEQHTAEQDTRQQNVRQQDALESPEHRGPQPTNTDTPVAEVPFVVEHRQEDRTPHGHHRPASRLVLTPALRTGGLWAALPPEDFKTLILMLTFLTPNGW